MRSKIRAEVRRTKGLDGYRKITDSFTGCVKIEPHVSENEPHQHFFILITQVATLPLCNTRPLLSPDGAPRWIHLYSKLLLCLPSAKALFLLSSCLVLLGIFLCQNTLACKICVENIPSDERFSQCFWL